MKKLAIFASGSGTNAENIAKYFLEKEGIATVELVLTNRRNAWRGQNAWRALK